MMDCKVLCILQPRSLLANGSVSPTEIPAIVQEMFQKRTGIYDSLVPRFRLLSLAFIFHIASNKKTGAGGGDKPENEATGMILFLD